MEVNLDHYFFPKIGLTDDQRWLANGWTMIGNLLATAGVPSSGIPFATAQVMFETGGLKSHISAADFNYSGIKFINKPYQNATKGNAAPEGGNYAHFATRADWAKDFKRILSLGKNPPLQATTIDDYVNRLAANHYFTSSPGAYLQGLKTILLAAQNMTGQQKQELNEAEKNYNITDHSITLKPGVFLKNKLDLGVQEFGTLSLTEKIIVGVVGLIVVVKIISDE